MQTKMMKYIEFNCMTSYLYYIGNYASIFEFYHKCFIFLDHFLTSMNSCVTFSVLILEAMSNLLLLSRIFLEEFLGIHISRVNVIAVLDTLL